MKKRNNAEYNYSTRYSSVLDSFAEENLMIFPILRALICPGHATSA